MVPQPGSLPGPTSYNPAAGMMLPPPAMPNYPGSSLAHSHYSPQSGAPHPIIGSSAFANPRFGPSGGAPMTTASTITTGVGGSPTATTAAPTTTDAMNPQLSVRLPSSVLPMLPESTSSRDIANIAASFPPIITLPDRTDSGALPLPLPRTGGSGELSISAPQWQAFAQGQMQGGGASGLQPQQQQVGAQLGALQAGVQGAPTQSGASGVGAHTGQVGTHQQQQQPPAAAKRQPPTPPAAQSPPSAAAAAAAAPKGVKRQNGATKKGGASRKAARASGQRTPGGKRETDHSAIEVSRIRVTPQHSGRGGKLCCVLSTSFMHHKHYLCVLIEPTGIQHGRCCWGA